MAGISQLQRLSRTISMYCSKVYLLSSHWQALATHKPSLAERTLLAYQYRSDKIKWGFESKSPRDLTAQCACHLVSLCARGAEACGNAADDALLKTGLGQLS